MCACSFAQSDSCDPKDYSLPGFSVHGISQAEILEWVAISFSRGLSQPKDWTCVSCIGRWLLYHWTTWEVLQKTEPETQVYMITRMGSAIPGLQEWGGWRVRLGDGRGVQTSGSAILNFTKHSSEGSWWLVSGESSRLQDHMGHYNRLVTIQ